MHSGGLRREAVAAMLTPSEVAQPFDRAILGGLPCRMSGVLAGSTPTAAIEIVWGYFEFMSVLATNLQLFLGRDVLVGEQRATALFNAFLGAPKKIFLSRTRFPAAVLASMLKLALSAIVR